MRAPSVHVYGPRTKLINMIVHDGEQGIASWSQAVDSELYGNLIYNVGFETGTQGQGHSIYVQNEDGVKRIVDNILFNSHSFGVHAYTEAGRIDNIYLEGNTAFNHGLLSREGAKANYLFRSKGQRPQNVTLVSNYGYYPGGVSRTRGQYGDSDSGPDGLCQWCLERQLLGLAGYGPCAHVSQSIGTLGGNTFVGPTFGFDPRTVPQSVCDLHPDGNRGVCAAEPVRTGSRQRHGIQLGPSANCLIDLTGIGLESGNGTKIRDARSFLRCPRRVGDLPSVAARRGLDARCERRCPRGGGRRTNRFTRTLNSGFSWC